LAEQAAIPFAPVARPQDLFEDPHLNASGSLVTATLPNGQTAKLPKIPLRLDHESFELRRNTPRIGEGSKDRYRALGFSDDEIRNLAQRGVIEIPGEELAAE